MKRKKPIPGVRLLLCALLAVAALVGVTQRAEAAYTEDLAGSITMAAPRVISDAGNCNHVCHILGSSSSLYKQFQVFGPASTVNSDGYKCLVNATQNTVHEAALDFTNNGDLPGELVITYRYDFRNAGRSTTDSFKCWVQKEGESDIVIYDGPAKTLNADETVKIHLEVNESASVRMRVVSDPGTYKTYAIAFFQMASVKFVLEGKPVDVTFRAPETYGNKDTGGSYTVSYTDTAGDTVTKSMTKTTDAETINIKSDTDVTLKANPTGSILNFVFRDWYDVTNEKTLSTSNDFTTHFSNNTTITARYIDLWSTPLFEVTGQTFTDLGEAIEYAQDNKLPTVRLVKSGRLDYDATIPAGITLLIPYAEKNASGDIWNKTPDLWQSSPKKDNPDKENCTDDGVKNNLKWRYQSVNLTLATNITLTIANGGAVEVGGVYGIRQGKSDGCFAPIKRYGRLTMNPDSRITVQGGGKLYAWGYITGDGTVTAENGAEVWELFQIMDWCGGTEATDRQSADVFPFTQYYVQNIEAELVLQAGAKDNVVASLIAGKPPMVGTGKATLIGSGEEGLFRLDNGAELRRKYNTTEDRIEYTIPKGTVSLANILLTLDGHGLKVDSRSFVLPINGNTTVNIESGAVLFVTSDTSLLPGVEVNIENGGMLAMHENAHLYIYDCDQWVNKKFCYSNADFQSVAFSPNQAEANGYVNENTYPLKIRTNESLQDVKIDINGTLYGYGNVYTTAGGANICSSKYTGVFVAAKNTDPNFSGGILKQKVIKQNPTIIPTTLAKLKNGDGATAAYTQTAAPTTGKINYYYYNPFNNTWGTERVVYAKLDYNYPGAPAATTIQSSEKLPTPDARPGYTFTGWNTQSDGKGKPYDAEKAHDFTTDTTLYAQWKAKTYTLTIAANGAPLTEAAKNLTLKKAGGNTIPQETNTSLKFKVDYGDEIILPTAHEFGSRYSGSTLSGWKTVWCDKPTAYPLGAKITISDELAYGNPKENIAIQAQWSREDYTVTAESRLFNSQLDWTQVSLNYNQQTSPIADVSLDGAGTYKLSENQTITVIAPEKDGYTFQGWYCGYRLEDSKYRFSTELKASMSLRELAEKSNMLANGKDTNGHIRLVAVYTKNATAAPLTLKLDKAPSDVEVSVAGVNQTAKSDGTWSVPVGTEVTIDASNVPGFQYWTNANDKVMSKEKTYKFTMVTDTTLTAETSTSNTFVIFQSADERLLSVQSDLNALTLPAAPYRVGYEFKGWSIDGADPVPADKVSAALSGKNSVVTVTAAYEEITEAEYTVTATANVSGVTIEGSGSSYKLGEIAKFTAPEASSDGSAFRFWASNKDGTNILSFSTTYSFRVTQNIEIYVIYGGEAVTDRPPVVRVDSVLKNDSPQSLTFMIGASIPDGYTLVEMGALYTKDVDSGNDTTLRVENVNNSTVRKAVSRLKHEDKLTDYSYALGFNMTGKLTDTISLRGYVAVKKTDNNTIYYYYSGVHSASYQSLSGTSS